MIVQSPDTSMSVSPNALAHALKYIRRVLHHEGHHQKLVRHYGHPSHLKRRCAAKVTPGPRDPIAGPPEAHLIKISFLTAQGTYRYSSSTLVNLPSLTPRLISPRQSDFRPESTTRARQKAVLSVRPELFRTAHSRSNSSVSCAASPGETYTGTRYATRS